MLEGDYPIVDISSSEITWFKFCEVASDSGMLFISDPVNFDYVFGEDELRALESLLSNPHVPCAHYSENEGRDAAFAVLKTRNDIAVKVRGDQSYHDVFVGFGKDKKPKYFCIEIG